MESEVLLPTFILAFFNEIDLTLIYSSIQLGYILGNVSFSIGGHFFYSRLFLSWYPDIFLLKLFFSFSINVFKINFWLKSRISFIFNIWGIPFQKSPGYKIFQINFCSVIWNVSKTFFDKCFFLPTGLTMYTSIVFLSKIFLFQHSVNRFVVKSWGSKFGFILFLLNNF